MLLTFRFLNIFSPRIPAHDMNFALNKCSDEKRCFLCEIQNLTLALFCPLIFSKGKKLIAWCSTLLSGRVWKELSGVELCQSCVRLWREYPFHAPWIIIGVIHTTKRRRFNLDNCRFIALLYLQIDCFHAPVCNTAHDGAAGMILIGRDLHSRHFLAQKSNLPVPCLWRYYGNHWQRGQYCSRMRVRCVEESIAINRSLVDAIGKCSSFRNRGYSYDMESGCGACKAAIASCWMET